MISNLKIKCIDDLLDFLDNDLAWRKKEMTQIISNYNEVLHKPIFLEHYSRVALTLIYAHWEGYIKHSAQAYLLYINSLKHKYSDLSDNFLLLGLKNNVTLEHTLKSSNNRKKVVDFITLSENEKFTCDVEQIDTASNLKIDILKEILILLKFDNSLYINKKTWIDERLLKYRNAIAHGEKIHLNQLDFKIEDLKNEIQALLEIFRTQISNSIALKSYLR